MALFLSSLPGCDGGSPGAANDVVVYTSIDEPVARPILDEFTRRTGVRVSALTDTEANKSAGLVARLEAEKANPRADVWWGNEVFRTINLAGAGVLAPYESPAAKDVPPLFRDPSHLWAGSALRARVLVVHAHPLKDQENPLPNDSILDLTRPELSGSVAIANPRAGTTSGHAAALYALWGEQKAEQYFKALRANRTKVLGGNGDVAAQTAAGAVLVGLTDNDDVDNVLRERGHVRMVLPDQKKGGIGTLTIPCTVAMVKGAPHPDNAKKLIDYLVSAEVEKRLIDAKFARYAVRGGGSSEPVKPMRVDYRDVAKVLPHAARRAEAILVGRE